MSTDIPRNPSAAPTQMKTKPSGRFDFCMNGAPLVSGTMRGGIGGVGVGVGAGWLWVEVAALLEEMTFLDDVAGVL